MAFATLFIISLLFLHLMSAFGNVTSSFTLSTNHNDAWLSPSGDFAFGFRQLNGTNLFMVAIWYDNIPAKTIVWNAKANKTLAIAPTGSQVQVTSGGLILKTPEGESIWIAQPNATVSYGAMLDTGNFVLVNKNTFVWESFKNPSDTLLPNQSLEQDGKLTSRLTESNYTSGRFQLYFQNGDLLLSPLAWPSQLHYRYYYRINASQPFLRLVFNNLGKIYVETVNGTRIQPQRPTWGNSTLDPERYYYRATLDFNGVFTQYAHPRSNSAYQGWTIMRYVPDNICKAIFNEYGSGACGYNSYCSMENDRPACKCLYGYSLVDPGNQFGGCQPNFTLACGADVQAPPEELYEMHEFRNFNFPLADYEKKQPYSQEECQQSCLQDCICALAILGGDICWMKRLPLSNGKVAEVSDQHFAYIKTRVSHDFYPHGNRELPPGTDSKKDQPKPILYGSLIVSLVVNSVLLATVVLLILSKSKVKRVVVQGASLSETNLYKYTYETLEKATWGFSEQIGRGSFGIVYKGKLEAPCNMVAIKKLDRLTQEREKEFRTELSAIGKTATKIW